MQDADREEGQEPEPDPDPEEEQEQAYHREEGQYSPSLQNQSRRKSLNQTLTLRRSRGRMLAVVTMEATMKPAARR